ncbi:MAG: response regulator [Syntrophobacteraceae bacterium]
MMAAGGSMGVRVLVVDDEVEFADLLHDRLEARGFEVLTAYSGDEALEKLEEANPDVVILDVMLPGRDGLSTLKEIKQRLPLAGVIMLTGNANIETAVEGMKLGAYDFLIKPTEIAVLVERINRAHRRKTEQEDRIRNAGIDEIMGPVGDLAVGIAHEINNPVGIMVEEAGWIDDLLEEVNLPENESLHELKRALKQIRAQGERCKQITHKLLTFGRRTDPKRRDVQMNDLIESVAASARKSLPPGVRIETRYEPELPIVSVSSMEMQQVLLNLIGNAVDAVGGEDGLIEIRTKKDGDFVVIEVADNGCGIPKANIGRIFDPFFTTKPVGRGTGLGLSICYGLVKKHDGDISVESEPGAGSIFRVRLPIHGADGAGSERGEEAPVADGR